MPSPFWIHCNICSMEFCKEVKMYMLDCGHVLCKVCMNRTERGTKCPFCKTSIKFEELAKLSDDFKSFFKPNILNSVLGEIQKIKFQGNQQVNLLRTTLDSKMKYQKASLITSTLEQDVIKMKAEHEKTVAHRKLMQMKLKEIYDRNQMKRDVPYRSNASSVSSFGLSHWSTPSNNSSSFIQSPASTASTRVSDFFQKNAPMMVDSQSGRSSVISGFSGISITAQSLSKRKSYFA